MSIVIKTTSIIKNVIDWNVSQKDVNVENSVICQSVLFVRVDGSQDFKCHCKHSYTDHNPGNKRCRFNCAGCIKGFNSTWSCQCGYKYMEHKTTFVFTISILYKTVLGNRIIKLIGKWWFFLINWRSRPFWKLIIQKSL